MATFSFVLGDYIKANGKQSIRLRVTENRESSYRPVGFEILSKDWDNKKERVKTSHINSNVINDVLRIKLDDAENAYALLVASGSEPTSELIIQSAFASKDFYVIADKFIAGITSIGTRERYKSVIKKLKLYKPTLTTKEVTSEFINKYKKYLSVSGGRNGNPNAYNTIVANLSALRAIINASPVFKKINPFHENDLKVGTFRKSNKETLTVDEIELVKKYIPSGKWDAFAKDLFLFSYYAAGMRFTDVINMEWRHIKGERIIYDVSKVAHSTSLILDIPLNAETSRVISKYKNDSNYIFNILTKETEQEIFNETKKVNILINEGLQSIMFAIEVHKHITFNCARHTFAQIARESGDVYGIKSALGHATITTTEIYLGEDQKAIDGLLKKVYG